MRRERRKAVYRSSEKTWLFCNEQVKSLKKITYNKCVKQKDGTSTSSSELPNIQLCMKNYNRLEKAVDLYCSCMQLFAFSSSCFSHTNGSVRRNGSPQLNMYYENFKYDILIIWIFRNNEKCPNFCFYPVGPEPTTFCVQSCHTIHSTTEKRSIFSQLLWYFVDFLWLNNTPNRFLKPKFS